jgi:hypothetical protein
MSQSRLSGGGHGSVWPWVLCLGGGVLVGAAVYLNPSWLPEAAPERAAAAPSSPAAVEASPAASAVQALTTAPVEQMPAMTADKEAAINAAQRAAAKVVAEQPDMAPIVGPITARPAFVSPMEWDMLQGAAGQQAVPALALTRMVKALRFAKQLEWLQAQPQQVDLVRRQAMAEHLLVELPERLSSGDMDLAEAARLVPTLVTHAEPNAAMQPGRIQAEHQRLRLPPPVDLAAPHSR